MRGTGTACSVCVCVCVCEMCVWLNAIEMHTCIDAFRAHRRIESIQG
jgi:hypothetical protein